MELATYGSNLGKLVPCFEKWQFLELGARGCKISEHSFQRFGTGNFQNQNPVVPSLQGTDFNLWEPAVPGTGNTRFQDWKQLFQRLKTGSFQNWEPLVPRLGSTSSNVWEPLGPRTGNSRFQDSETLVPTFGNQQFRFRRSQFDGIKKAFLKRFLSGAYAGVIRFIASKPFLNAGDC